MALRLFLGNQYPLDRIMPASNWRELLFLELTDLKRYDLFQGHFSCGLLDLLPADVTPITFLREPVARTISHLKHLRRDPSFSPMAYEVAAGRGLDELVRDERIIKLCCDVQASLLCNYIPGETILAGLRADERAGHIPDPDAFAAPADLATQPLPRRNFDPEGSTDPNALSPETLAIIRERNAIDIALYEAVKQRVSMRPPVTQGDIGWNLLAYGIYQPISEPVEFAMDGPIPGSNWYAWEDSAGGGHRWTGPLTETTLELPLAPGLDFEISMQVRIEKLGDLTVRAGDAELGVRVDASDGHMHRIAFWVPAERVERDGLTTLRFETREVFQASATDLRPLSFLVRALSVSRVEPAGTAAPLPAVPVPAPTGDAPRRRAGRR
ncbi:MAG: hypothetical protein E6G81_10150 [Alphaproteobacteria bacterium]|nr:MAG: hypothetical protein E6G81_10150 [Alphaproteobacteria bacterium]